MPVGRPRSETARQAILAATRDELADRGYDKLSIDRIAAAAGVGKQTVYRWYPSKSSLVAECLLHGYVTTPSIDVDLSGDARSDIRAWVHEFAAKINEPGTQSLIRAASAASAEDATIAHQFDEQIHRTRTALTSQLQRGEEAGQLKAGTAASSAEVIVGALLYRLGTRQTIPTRFVEELIDIIFDGIDQTTPPTHRTSRYRGQARDLLVTPTLTSRSARPPQIRSHHRK